MKIRIKDNSLRLRLSQTEVQELSQTGQVRAKITFSPQVALVYEVQSTTAETLSSSYQENCISVFIPKAIISNWANSNEVSIQAEQLISEKEQLSVLVEKDFKCLSDRPGENEADLFPHPKEGDLLC
jgi:hypothetical protein